MNNKKEPPATLLAQFHIFIAYLAVRLDLSSYNIY